MKYFLLLSFLVTFLTNGSMQTFSQNRLTQKEVIVIEILVPNSDQPEKIEIPINKRKGENDYNGIGSVSHCISCNYEERAAMPLSYDLIARAYRMGKDKVNVGIVLNADEDRCKTVQIFSVNRNGKTNMKLKCGANITAYYGTELVSDNEVGIQH